MTQSDIRPGLKLVEEPTRSLGESLAGLAETNHDWFDRHMRQHVQPNFEAARDRELETARQLLFGDRGES